VGAPKQRAGERHGRRQATIALNRADTMRDLLASYSHSKSFKARGGGRKFGVVRANIAPARDREPSATASAIAVDGES